MHGYLSGVLVKNVGSRSTVVNYYSLPPSINDHEVCAELLLERMNTQEVNSKDRKGRNVVHASAFGNSGECLQLLLKKGVEISEVDDQGQTPLMVAAKHGHTTVVGESLGISILCDNYIIFT